MINYMMKYKFNIHKRRAFHFFNINSLYTYYIPYLNDSISPLLKTSNRLIILESLLTNITQTSDSLDNNY